MSSHLDYEINKELGECYLFMGDLDKAEEYYRKAMASNGVHADPYLGLATVAIQRGNIDDALNRARAILGLPIPVIRQLGPSASCAVLAHGHGVPLFGNVAAALQHPDTQLRLFGKPRVAGHRRVAVTLARAETLEAARAMACNAAEALDTSLRND